MTDLDMRVPRCVLSQHALEVERHLGRRVHEHWLVRQGSVRLVLRRCSPKPYRELSYELAVLDQLAGLGWPVPTPVQAPFEADRSTWVLFTHLPGTHPQRAPSEQQRRGQLLAQLHADLETLGDLGQRAGWVRSEQLLDDPELDRQLGRYEPIDRDAARLLRRHLERARAALADADAASRDVMVIHSDFTHLNVLYDQGRLTGILDFETTHLNHRVADFALSWRGKHDDVIHGYEQVRPLSDVDWELLTPVFWAWTYIGMTQYLADATSQDRPVPSLAWPIRMLQRRSPLMGAHASFDTAPG